jgi:DNA invertase Pin-like site-specific DNA recombinase
MGVEVWMRVATYARVSTDEQTTQNQTAELDRYLTAQGDGVEVFGRFVDDGVSGSKLSRPAFDRMLKAADEGAFDVLVFWKLDRLGRNTQHLLETVERLKRKGIEVVSLRESIDTRSSAGKAFLGMLAVFAQFERDVLIERTRAGQARARAQGKHMGRPAGSRDSSPRVRTCRRHA